MTAPYQKYLKEILIDADVLQTRVTELGQQISQDYSSVNDLLLICILKGGVMFLSDLSRNISPPHEIDFMAASSYGRGARASSGNVRIDMDIMASVTNRNILIVEDIVDTGLSIQFIKNMLKNYKPASVKIASLLVKPESLKYKTKIDYIGFEIPNKFVIGYGLDYAQKFRNLNSIYALSE